MDCTATDNSKTVLQHNPMEKAIAGQRYETVAPDTLDLADRLGLAINALKAADKVTLTFPVATRTEHRVLGEIPYKLTLRGSNVVDIDPKGVACPLYQNQPTGSLLKKRRFAPDVQNLVW